MLDFLRALREAKPHYGAAGAAVSQQWARHQRMGFVAFRPEVPMLVEKLLATLDKAAGGGILIGDDKAAAPPANKLPLITILLQGPAGAGKTALLAKVASMANRFTFRRYLSGQELVGLGDDAAACDVLVQAVQDAHQCPRSLLLLDDLEALVQYIPFQKDGAGRVSSPRLHTLLALLGRTPAKVGRMAVVLATTSLPPATLQQLGIWSKFSLRLELPLVETDKHVEALLGGAMGVDFCGEGEDRREEMKGPWTVREVLERQALGVMGREKKIEKVEEQVEEGQ
jgi:vesicle-fusing ATPase